MLTYVKVRWKNFLSTGNSWTEVYLNKNKNTLIVGVNGAGKSTLLCAISFALYGRAFRNINKPTICNSINKKDCCVELDFIVNNKKYKIIRGLKPNIFKIYCEGVLINQSSETKEYQEYLEKHILRSNFKSFSQIVVLGSASFTPFMQLKAGDRREFIEDLLDIHIFSTMNSLLKDKINDNKTKITQIDFQIKLCNEKKEIHRKYVQSLQQNNNVLIEEKTKKKETILELLKTLKDSNNDYTQKVNNLKKSINDKESIQSKLDEILPIERKLDNKISKLKDEQKFYHDHSSCPKCKQNIDHEFKESNIQDIKKEEEKLVVAKQKLKEKKIALQKRLEEIVVVESEISDIKNSIRDQEINIRMNENSINSLNADIEKLKNISDKMEDNTDELDSIEKEIDEFIEDKNNCYKQKDIFDVASVILKDSGVKTKIIKQYIPIINKLVNKYLSDMGFFVNFELNENFEECIKSRYRDDFSYESFSEGEKMRIDIALLFTWRMISKLRNSISTNLLIMDEVFDRSLDSSGNEDFFKLIQSLSADTNLFVISHKSDQLMDKFENVIKFEKHKNFSQIVN